MKRLINLFFAIGLTIFLFSCSDNNPIAPESSQGDQVTTSLEKVKTSFTGICAPTIPPNEGDNAWYDDASDARVTGVSVWVTKVVNPINEITTELGGTAELTVDGCLGKWEMSWRGVQTLTSPDGSTFRIVAHAVGIGKEGQVKGLIAKWKYTMNYDGTPETLKYYIKGKIIE